VKIAEKYHVSQALMSNYFYKNAFERFTNSIQEFMLWRRGSFLPPHKKEIYIEQFISEEIIDYYEKGIMSLPSVQFPLTTRCTLRCRDCSVMIPRFGSGEAAHVEMTFVRFQHDFDRIVHSVDRIRSVQLVGGEPLLNKELPQIAAYAAKNEKVGLVDIVTNCTVIPSRELIDAVRTYKHKVFFGLSNYTANEDLAPVLKRSEIIALLQENDIKHTLDTGKAKWFQYELKECDYTGEQMRAMFANCQWRCCLYVLDGILAVCPRSLVGEKLGAFLLADNEKINLESGDMSSLRSCLAALHEKDYVSACRYCLRHTDEVDPAVQERYFTNKGKSCEN
jgi:organic radical activating enzyme